MATDMASHKQCDGAATKVGRSEKPRQQNNNDKIQMVQFRQSLCVISLLLSMMSANAAFSFDLTEMHKQRTACALKARTVPNAPRPLPTDGSAYTLHAWIHDPQTLEHTVGKIGDSEQQRIRSSSDGNWTLECKNPGTSPSWMTGIQGWGDSYKLCLEKRIIYECLVQEFGWIKEVDKNNVALIHPPK